MIMKIKTAALRCSFKPVLSIIFATMFFGCFAQDESKQNFKANSFIGVGINYRAFPSVYSTETSVFEGTRINYREEQSAFEFGISYEKQVKKNWYCEFGIPYLRYNNRINTISEATSIFSNPPPDPTILEGEALRILDIAARYEYGYNGWRLFDEKLTIAFAMALQLAHENSKTTPLTSATFLRKSNLVALELQGSPKITYQVNDRIRCDLKFTHEVITAFHVSEEIADPTLSQEEQNQSDRVWDMDFDDVTLGLALKVALN